MSPHADFRGRLAAGSYDGAVPACAQVDWPGVESAAYRTATYGATAPWNGSLVDLGGDATGLQYMRNRYYNPATGQFTQADPLGVAGGVNVYGFSAGDPINYADPFGLFELKIEGERLKQEVAELRAKDPKADSAFRVLEQSKELFVIADADEVGCDFCRGRAGRSIDVPEEIRGMGALGLAELAQKNDPKVRGWAFVNRKSPNTTSQGAAVIAWHEAVHLEGIPLTGHLYIHDEKKTCPKAAQGVPGWCN